MPEIHDCVIARLIIAAIGADAAGRMLRILAIAPDLLRDTGETVSRAVCAMALNVLLFADLLDRVPSARAYVEAQLAAGQRISFDHGALRTIRFAQGPTGALPAGQDAFARILAPLGYHVAGIYPLPALRMTGRAWAHADRPAAIPQFFVSELHVERFDAAFEHVAQRVFGPSRDPLDAPALALLATFAEHGQAAFAATAAALPTIAAAFGCQHAPAEVADYEALRTHSAEAAWIATEGNAFNHATDRVGDVAALAAALKAAGQAMKDRLEVSTNGRVRQTALRADPVERVFADGIARLVPGSFYEFISRDIDPATGALDLSFDSGNATGIFAMTKTA